MGEIPIVIVKPAVKPKQGDVRAMVLPGGGDLTTRVWASMRVKINSLVKWQALGARETSAATDAITQLEDFATGEGEVMEHIWKDVPEKEALQIKVETIFLIDSFGNREKYNADDLLKLMDRRCRQSLERGKQKAKEALEERISKALLNGAGAAHRMTAVDHALPPLRLTVKKQLTTGPHPREWGANCEAFQKNIASYFIQLRKKIS